MTSLSTHVLDTVTGTPAHGLVVVLRGAGAIDGTSDLLVARATTDDDGRAWLAEDLVPGDYRLAFETGPWCAAAGRETLYPEVVVAFTLPAAGHLHVPLLLSPHAYTTYRGS